MSATTGPVIEVFADVWCPFAHVGLRAIEDERARTGRIDVAIWVRAWPLELVNGVSLDPKVMEKHAEELREQVAPNLFRHLDVDRFPRSTLDALALANRAYRTDLQVGERVSFALRDALFEEGRDISDPQRLSTWRMISGSLCLTRLIAPTWWRTGTKADGVEYSARRTSSVVTTTSSVRHWTSPRTPSRACRLSGTSRVLLSSWRGAWPNRGPHDLWVRSSRRRVNTPQGIE